MLRYAKQVLILIGITCLGLLVLFSPNQRAVVLAQQPTGSVPTVTGTAAGPTIRVDPSIDIIPVHAGPSSFDYPQIGLLVGNEVAPALGRARDRLDWIQIYYPGVPGKVGWVYGLYVSLSPGAFLPIVDIPATPTPISTPTINPTLESAFIGQQVATRLPTFTPPPPLDLPLFNDTDANTTRTIPAGLLIISLGLFGFFGAVISYLRGR